MVEQISAVAAGWIHLWGAVTLKTLIVLCVAGLCWLIVRRRSAASRHFLLTAAVFVMAALPLLSVLMPAWHIRGLPATFPVTTGMTEKSVGQSATDESGDLTPTVTLRKERPSDDRFPAPGYSSKSPFPGGAPIRAEFSPNNTTNPYNPAVRHSSTFVSLDINEATAILLMMWLAGVMVVGMRYAGGLVRLFWLMRIAVPMDENDAEEILPEAMRSVKIVLGGSVPLTFGWLRPVVVVPSDFEDWTPDRQRAVVLHECAHIARRDWPAALISQVSCALYWYNPLVWMIDRQMCVEAEHACDDSVLLAGMPPSDYAEHLLGIALAMRGAGRQPAGAIAMASRPLIIDRMQSILDAGRHRRAVSIRTASAGTLCALAIAMPLAAMNGAVQHTARLGELTQPGDGETVAWNADDVKPAKSFARPDAENRLMLVGQFDWPNNKGFFLNLENSSYNGELGLDTLKLALGVADSKGFHFVEATPAWQYGHDYHVRATITPAGTKMLLDDQKFTLNSRQLIGTSGFPLVVNQVPMWAIYPAEYWIVEKSVTITLNGRSVLRYELPCVRSTAGPSDFANPSERQNDNWGVPPGQTVTLDVTFRLVRRADYAPLVDRYGQSRYPDWPNKILSDQQLADSASDEKYRLDALAGLNGYDQYGGNESAGWNERATGFYRVVTRNGYSWLITPAGNPCWYTAVCNTPDLGADNGTPVTGRESLFSYLPRPAPNSEGDTTYVSYPALNMQRKYGVNWRQTETDLLKARFRSWGFVGQGEWSDHVDGLPYISVIGQDQPAPDQMDVFDSSVRLAIRTELQHQMQPSINDPYLVGWSVTGGDPDVTSAEMSDLLASAGISSEKSALVEYALRYIYHGHVNKMAKRWHSGTASVTELCALPNTIPASDAGILCAYLTDQYEAFLYAAVKSIDPHHLYFSNWAYAVGVDAVSKEKAAMAHCDVFTFVVGSPSYPTDYVTALVAKSHKPVFWGRAWCTPDYGGVRGFSVPIGHYTSNDAQTGVAYAARASSAAVSQSCIGMSWFQYRDQPVTGSGPGSGSGLVYGSNQAYGVVDVADRPKWELIEPMREANLNVNQERLDVTASAAASGKD